MLRVVKPAEVVRRPQRRERDVKHFQVLHLPYGAVAIAATPWKTAKPSRGVVTIWTRVSDCSTARGSCEDDG